MRQHWYRIHWCQACGREERERIYGPKPADPSERFAVYYCGCLNWMFY